MNVCIQLTNLPPKRLKTPLAMCSKNQASINDTTIREIRLIFQVNTGWLNNFFGSVFFYHDAHFIIFLQLVILLEQIDNETSFSLN